MTTTDPKRDQPGYRGALPTRDDRLARPWIIAVFAILAAVILLSALQVPSRFEPEPTPRPIISIPPTPSPSPTVEPTESPPEPSGSGVPDASGSASPSPTEEP